MTIRCKQCNCDCTDDAQFCCTCGSSLARKCPKCNSLVQTDSNFCENCGARCSGNLAKDAPVKAVYEGSWRLTTTLEDCLKEVEWEVRPTRDMQAGTSTTSFTVDLNEHDAQGYFEISESAEVLEMYLYVLDTPISNSVFSTVSEFISRLNNRMTYGHFQLVERDDNYVIRYVNAIDVVSAPFATAHIKRICNIGAALLQEALSMLDKILLGESIESAMAN